MKKCRVSYRYSMRGFLQMSAWYLILYPVLMALIYLILFQTGVISHESGSLIYRIWGSVIFLFAISIRFREDLDCLLTYSFTRSEIFWGRVCTALSFSALFSGLIVLERLLVDYFNAAMGFVNINDAFHFFSPYASQNNGLLFLYFFMLCACGSVAGQLLGSLFYRLGKGFTLTFWLLFSALPLIVAPALFCTKYQRGELTQCVNKMALFLKTFDVLAAAGWMLLALVLLSGALYWNMRRLPQR